jgi:DNA repair exonuclease
MIVHFSDTHLGKIQYNLIEREEDIYNTFDEIINKIIEVRPNVVYTQRYVDLVKPPSKAIESC